MNDTLGDWWAGIPIVLAACRAGSATAAAHKLGTTPATALRRLSAVEQALDVVLFDRTPTGLVPTLALELVLPWAEQIEAAAFGLQTEVRGFETKPEGVVRLALLPGVSNHLIAPMLPSFRDRFPGLVMELLPASAVVDLNRREADIAIRGFAPRSGDLVVKRVATFSMAVVAAPALIEKRRPAVLSDLPWLTFGTDLDATAEALWLASVVPQAEIALRCSELETLLRAAQAGVGALFLGEPMAVAAGGLARVPTPTPPMPEGALYLVAHRALRPVPRVSVVWDWLSEFFDDSDRRGRLTLP